MSNQLSRGRSTHVLLVEDNDNDVELTRLGFRRARFAVELHHVGDGEKCMAFLRKEGEYRDAPTPELILLDLEMPRMDGHEVLEEIARDPRLTHLPIVVLTTSDAHTDVLSSYKLRCSSCIVKPFDFERFASVVRGIANDWFTLVVLPTDSEL